MSPLADVFTWLGEHLMLLAIPFLIWMARTMLKVSQTVYGENGSGGLVKAVEKLTDIVGDHAAFDIRLIAAQKRGDEAVEQVKELTTNIVSAFEDLRSRVGKLEARRTR